MLKYLFPLLLLSGSALAQQQTPPEVALQMNAVIGTWAQTLVQQGRTIDDLKKQLATAQDRIKELEPKKDDEPR